MKTGIIILNYNGSRETIKCIQSIERHNSADIRYIIIDNGSSQKGETEVIDNFLQTTFPGQYVQVCEQGYPKEEERAKAIFLASQSNDGFAKGNNKGLRIALSDNAIDDILILNNDVTFDSDIIPILLSHRDILGKVGILTPIIYNLNGEIEHTCARRFPSNWQVMLPFILFRRDVFHILSKSSNSQKELITNPGLLHEAFFPIGMPSGACMLIKKEILQDINGLDEGTFLYYEENILCKQLQDKGLVNYCVPRARVIHIGGASTAKTESVFLQKCNLESADHYLKHFSKMTLFQRIIWWIVFKAWNLKFRFKRP